MAYWWQDRGFRLTHKPTGIAVVYRTRTAYPKPDDIAVARRWLSSLVAHASRPKPKPIRRNYILAPEYAARVMQGPSVDDRQTLAEGQDAVLAMLAGNIPGPILSE